MSRFLRANFHGEVGVGAHHQATRLRAERGHRKDAGLSHVKRRLVFGVHGAPDDLSIVRNR